MSTTDVEVLIVTACNMTAGGTCISKRSEKGIFEARQTTQCVKTTVCFFKPQAGIY
jgi:hypothetical protein